LPTLLLEIGTEELPASACREATAQLPELAQAKLGRAPDELFVGPRRIAFLIRDFDPTPPKQWLQGPPLAIGLDAEGAPTKAAEGFARRYGVEAAALEQRDGFLGLEQAGAPIEERLADLVRSFSFGKSMVWRVGGLRFSRPVRWLVALLDQAPLALDVDGIPSSTFSQAHRFLATDPEVMIPTAEGYADALRTGSVEPSAEERRRIVTEGLDALGAWSDPLGKLEEVIYLVEHPHVLQGHYDERYLTLPERVRSTAMQ
jgi:glycyl-tRNA synthetase beta subunit